MKKTVTAKVSHSSSADSKLYLEVAWRSRAQLSERERRGFAQFFYLVLCGHIECLLDNKISSRLRSLEHHFPIHNLPPVEIKFEGIVQSYPLDPLARSVDKMISSIKDELLSAPLVKLMTIHDKLFQKSLNDSIGSELKADLDALSAMRNVFAHGRDVYMEFEGEALDAAIFDKNPLSSAKQRLQKAGIIKEGKVSGKNYNEFKKVFFSDKALLYFCGAVKQIESKLFEDLCFGHEKFFSSPLFPDLKAV